MSFIGSGNQKKAFHIRKLCLEEPEEIMEYEILRNREIANEIELDCDPEFVHDNRNGRSYVVIQWKE